MVSTPGMIGTSQISGSLDAKNIVMGVLQKAIELSNLESICGKTPVPELTATIPVATPGSVSEDLDEFESSDIEGGEFTYVSFDLKKDRVKFSVSDEAGYKSKAGDPLGIQKIGAATRLSSILDKKIVAALQTSPQTSVTGGAWSTITNSPLADLGLAVDSILPYKADFCLMPAAVHAKYLANDLIKAAGTGNPAAFKGAVGKVPGLDLDIFINSNCAARSCTVGSSTGLAAVIGNGPVKVRSWDAEELGAKMYQMDVFRQVKAPIFETSGGLNMSAYKLTAVIA
jgi:hypothetical protein